MSLSGAATTAGDATSLPVSVKGVLLRGSGRAAEVLLLRNDRSEWELPGGHPEEGETPEACLAREIPEETGLAVRVDGWIQNGVLAIFPPHVAKATRVLISAYGCSLQRRSDAHAPIAVSSEHKAAAWIRVDDLDAMSDLPEVYKSAVLHWQRASGL